MPPAALQRQHKMSEMFVFFTLKSCFKISLLLLADSWKNQWRLSDHSSVSSHFLTLILFTHCHHPVHGGDYILFLKFSALLLTKDYLSRAWNCYKCQSQPHWESALLMSVWCICLFVTLIVIVQANDSTTSLLMTGSSSHTFSCCLFSGRQRQRWYKRKHLQSQPELTHRGMFIHFWPLNVFS